MTLKITLLGDGWLILIIFLLLSVLIISCNSYYKKGQILSDSNKIEAGEFLKQYYKLGRKQLNFNIIYPKNFSTEKQYPLLLFLHGAGERGDDNEAQLKWGGDMIKEGANKHDIIVILPQCPKEKYWIDTLKAKSYADGSRNIEPDVKGPPSKPLKLVIGLMNLFLKHDYVDKSRVYVAGLSMGGMGTFDLCWRMPNVFAAASAICGAGSAEKASDFADLPMRIYHGEDDEIVSVKESYIMIEALKESGGRPEVFIYQGVEHDSWDNAFNEPDFLTWMLKHKKH